MPEVLNRASSALLDSPVKPGNDKNVVLLMNSLVTTNYLLLDAILYDALGSSLKTFHVFKRSIAL